MSSPVYAGVLLTVSVLIVSMYAALELTVEPFNDCEASESENHDQAKRGIGILTFAIYETESWNFEKAWLGSSSTGLNEVLRFSKLHKSHSLIENQL